MDQEHGVIPKRTGMRDKAHQGGNGETDDSIVMEMFGELVWTSLCFTTGF